MSDRIGLDIGGSLGKIVYFQPHDAGSHDLDAFIFGSRQYGSSGEREEHLSVSSASSPLKGKLHFIFFATHRMEGAIQLMQHANRSGSVCRIFATGGGAYKFETAITDKLRLSLVKFDEFSCLVRGLDFMLNHVPKECFRLRDAGGGRGHASGWKGAGVAEGESMDCVYEEGGAAGAVTGEEHARGLGGGFYPLIVVNVGSGVSILKVDSPDSFERVSGSSIGGGCFFGLARRLAGCETFKDALAMASSGGNPDSVDMLVGDIYGRDLSAVGLSADTLAASFGKLGGRECTQSCAPADLVAALLRMLVNNIAHLALMCARQHSCQRVLFVGSFFRYRSRISCRCCS
jgi:type II pantothenate kinase